MIQQHNYSFEQFQGLVSGMVQGHGPGQGRLLEKTLAGLGRPLGLLGGPEKAPHRPRRRMAVKEGAEAPERPQRGPQEPGTWHLVGATVPLAVGRQASDLDRPAPSMSRGISAAHGLCHEFRVQGWG